MFKFRARKPAGERRQSVSIPGRRKQTPAAGAADWNIASPASAVFAQRDIG
jgi:hypothetical protein